MFSGLGCLWLLHAYILARVEESWSLGEKIDRCDINVDLWVVVKLGHDVLRVGLVMHRFNGGFGHGTGVIVEGSVWNIRKGKDM